MEQETSNMQEERYESPRFRSLLEPTFDLDYAISDFDWISPTY